MGSSHGQQTIQGACVSETTVHDHGRRLKQSEFRPRAEVPFPPARQLSEYKGKGASASREDLTEMRCKNYYKIFDEKCTIELTGIKNWKIKIPDFFANWKNNFSFMYQSIKDNELRQFSFKLLNSITVN